MRQICAALASVKEEPIWDRVARNLYFFFFWRATAATREKTIMLVGQIRMGVGAEVDGDHGSLVTGVWLSEPVSCSNKVVFFRILTFENSTGESLAQRVNGTKICSPRRERAQQIV